MSARVDSTLSCGRFSLVVRKTNWVLSLISTRRFSREGIGLVLARVPSHGRTSLVGPATWLNHGDRQRCQRGTPATCDAKGAAYSGNVDTADFVGLLYSTIKTGDLTHRRIVRRDAAPMVLNL
jgi:hypothetical protein